MATDDELWEQATARIKARQGFWVHLTVYLVVNALLFTQWALTTPGAYYWPAWVAFGWGIGVLFHALGLFLDQREPSEDRIAREMTRMQHRGTSGPAPSH